MVFVLQLTQRVLVWFRRGGGISKRTTFHRSPTAVNPVVHAAGLLTEHSTLSWSETKHSRNLFLFQPSCVVVFFWVFVFFSPSSYNNCVLRLNCRGLKQRILNQQIKGAWCESSHNKSWKKHLVYVLCHIWNAAMHQNVCNYMAGGDVFKLWGKFFHPECRLGVRGGAVGWGTALQTGRSRVRFPVV